MLEDKLKNSNTPLIRKLANVKHLGLVVLVIVLISLLLVFTRSNQNNNLTDTNTSILFSESELRLEQMIEKISGVKDASVYINETNSLINSVVVLMDASDNLATQIKVLTAIQSALHITSDKVKIINTNN